MKTGIELIAEERERQICKEGWSPKHDDGHALGELSSAAGCYAAVASAITRGSSAEEWSYEMTQSELLPNWPWDAESWKPSDDNIRNLVKAGALIAAEIDRVQRESENKPKS